MMIKYNIKLIYNLIYEGHLDNLVSIDFGDSVYEMSFILRYRSESGYSDKINFEIINHYKTFLNKNYHSRDRDNLYELEHQGYIYFTISTNQDNIKIAKKDSKLSINLFDDPAYGNNNYSYTFLYNLLNKNIYYHDDYGQIRQTPKVVDNDHLYYYIYKYINIFIQHLEKENII
jgi:hypothetical protein